MDGDGWQILGNRLIKSTGGRITNNVFSGFSDMEVGANGNGLELIDSLLHVFNFFTVLSCNLECLSTLHNELACNLVYPSLTDGTQSGLVEANNMAGTSK